MPLGTGTVDAVSVKEMAKPDNYDNTHRISFKIGEDWYSAGASKGGSYINKDVKELNKGDVVEFMFDQNGDFKNVKRPTLTVTSKARVQQPAQQGYSKQGSSYSSVNPAEVGQCLNLAVQLGLAKSYDELSNVTTMARAINLYKGVKKQYTDNWEAAVEQEAQASAPENTGPVASDEFEEDIPF